MYNLGDRIVQKSGHLYFISLPASWVKNFRLEKGHKLKVAMSDDGGLVVSLKEQKNEKGEGGEK